MHSLNKLFDQMECYELANAFNLLDKQVQQMHDSLKGSKKAQSIIRSHLMMMLQHPNIFVCFIKWMIIGPMTVQS
jgi:hypothetical protein